MTPPPNHDDLVIFWLFAIWLGGIIPVSVLIRYTVFAEDPDWWDTIAPAFLWPAALVIALMIGPMAWYQISPRFRRHRSLTDCEREEWLQNGHIAAKRAYEAIYPEMPLRTTQESR